MRLLVVIASDPIHGDHLTARMALIPLAFPIIVNNSGVNSCDSGI
jgi:hypothetical protein